MSTSKLTTVAVALVVGACGSDSTSAIVDPFVEEMLSERCRIALECRMARSEETCEAVDGAARVRWELYKAAIRSGAILFDEVKAAACLDYLRSYHCQHYTHDESWARADSCGLVFTATRRDGERCTLGEECLAGSCILRSGDCDSGSSCCDGVCGSINGVECTNVSSTDATDALENMVSRRHPKACEYGFYCPGSAGACTPVKVVGEVCSYDHHECGGEARCLGHPDDGSGPGICGFPAERGAPCDPQYQGSACRHRDDHCDAVSLTCVPRPDVGDPCTLVPAVPPAGTANPCVEYARCRDGICVHKGGPGDPCTVTCDPWLVCSDDDACWAKNPYGICH